MEATYEERDDDVAHVAHIAGSHDGWKSLDAHRRGKRRLVRDGGGDDVADSRGWLCWLLKKELRRSGPKHGRGPFAMDWWRDAGLKRPWRKGTGAGGPLPENRRQCEITRRQEPVMGG